MKTFSCGDEAFSKIMVFVYFMVATAMMMGCTRYMVYLMYVLEVSSKRW